MPSTWLFRTALAAAWIALAGAASPARGQESASDSAAAGAENSPSVEGMNEQLQTLLSDVDKLKRFKFSGYVQARWEHAENQTDSVRVTGSPATLTPGNVERFYIRRGRLKLTYDSSPLSQAVVYVDGGADRTVRLLEAYVALLDPWTVDHRHQLWIGQMNVPFGYEIERSSSVRELPERSRAENVLFPGERDRGAKLMLQLHERLQATFGVFNGGGINDPDFPTGDPTKRKDWTARGRVSLGVADAAVSWYQGRGLVALTGPDVETDRTRLGFDAQTYWELPVVGGGSLRGEWYLGSNANADSVRLLTAAPGPPSTGRVLVAGADPSHLATDFSGGYVMWVQNFGDRLQAAARWEIFDPNTDRDHDQFERTSLGLNWFYDGNVRITAAYDIPRTDRSTSGGFEDPHDNLWTLQFQHKF